MLDVRLYKTRKYYILCGRYFSHESHDPLAGAVRFARRWNGRRPFEPHVQRFCHVFYRYYRGCKDGPRKAHLSVLPWTVRRKPTYRALFDILDKTCIFILIRILIQFERSLSRYADGRVVFSARWTGKKSFPLAGRRKKKSFPLARREKKSLFRSLDGKRSLSVASTKIAKLNSRCTRDKKLLNYLLYRSERISLDLHTTPNGVCTSDRQHCNTIDFSSIRKKCFYRDAKLNTWLLFNEIIIIKNSRKAAVFS